MTGMSMTEDNAETAKSRTPLDGANSSDIEINNYINARAGEITANILHQLEAAGFRAQNLPAGIILTGGGSKLRGFDRMLEAQAKMPVRLANIDGSLQFKGNGFDRTDNADILAIARYAAEKSDADCLAPLSDDEDPSEDYTRGDSGESGYHSNHGRRQVEVDDDNLLEDDSDEDDNPVSPTVRGYSKVKSHKNRRPVETEFDDDDDEYDDNSEDTGGKGHRFVIGIKDRLAKFWTKPVAEEDDLDDTVN